LAFFGRFPDVRREAVFQGAATAMSRASHFIAEVFLF
jgi:hypothetical protein